MEFENYYNKPYFFIPSDLVRNKTLEFFSRTLPILKADETLPRVAKYRQDSEDWNNNQLVYSP